MVSLVSYNMARACVNRFETVFFFVWQSNFLDTSHVCIFVYGYFVQGDLWTTFNERNLFHVMNKLWNINLPRMTRLSNTPHSKVSSKAVSSESLWWDIFFFFTDVLAEHPTLIANSLSLTIFDIEFDVLNSISDSQNDLQIRYEVTLFWQPKYLENIANIQ